MNTKSSIIKHPSGIEIETPLFVPSYSSKGFSLERKQDGKYKSEVCHAIGIAKEMLVESQLVSAYDLYYDYLLKPEEFIGTKITFIDSGGYETSGSFDFSETRRSSNDLQTWNAKLLDEVIIKWQNERFPAVIVNLDMENERKPLQEQVFQAKLFFSKKKNYLHDFLLKPETDSARYISTESIFKNINLLREFHIIGITEKELGNSLLERMQRIYKIRNELDKNHIEAPLHIFGSLDPITVILYYLVGAEIFDGLTWLKYSFYNGVAMYTNNLCALDNNIQITVTDSQVKAKSIANNIYYLDILKNVLLSFRINKDFKTFESLGKGLSEKIEQNYNVFKSRLKK